MVVGGRLSGGSEVILMQPDEVALAEFLLEQPDDVALAMFFCPGMQPDEVALAYFYSFLFCRPMK